jgi:hypothetical protein
MLSGTPGSHAQGDFLKINAAQTMDDKNIIP